MSRSGPGAARLLWALLLPLALLLPRDAAALAAGDSVGNLVAIAGKAVPLPPGTWEVAHLGTNAVRPSEPAGRIDPAGFGPIHNLMLVQREAGRVVALVEINANGVPAPDGWGIARDCGRTDLYVVLTRYQSGSDVSCRFVAPVVADDLAEAAPAWQAVERHARARGARLPGLWLAVGYRIANRHDVLDVRYHVSPAAFGLPDDGADAAAWTPATIEADPERLASVKQVAAWGSVMHKFVERGLRHRLAAGPFPPLRSAEPLAVPGERADRLADLRRLHDQGTLDRATYERQRQVIERETAPEASTAWTLSQVAAWKAATYRVVVTTINGGIDYLYIGRPFAAGVLVVLQVVVNTTKFYFHEMMWQEWLGVSPLQNSVARVLDFRYATAMRP